MLGKKGKVVLSDNKRNFLDDVVEGTRRLLDDLERALNPRKYEEEQQERVPVPVRVDEPVYPPRRDGRR